MAATASINHVSKPYNIENNNNIETLTFTVKRTSGTTHWDDNKSLIFRLTHYNDDGTTTTLTQTVQFNFKTNVSSKSVSVDFTVPHKTDGTQSITYEATIVTGTSVGTLHPTGSAILETIPRASAITCSSGNIEDVLSVKIGSNSNSFTHTITYTIGSYSGTLATKTSQTSLDFNTASIKDSIYSQIPNGTSISGTIRCTTYSGDTQVGDVKTSSFTLSASRERCCPVLSNVSCIDTNTNLQQFTGSNQKFIRYKSLPQVNFMATARNSSSIASYYISMSGGQAFTNKPCTFSNMVSNIITITATDSRGFSTAQTLQLDMIPYVIMSISGDIKRDEELSYEGFLTGAIAVYNGSLGLVDNTLSISYDYRKAEESTWTTGGTISNYTTSGNKVILNKVSLGNNYDPNYEYIVRIYTQDKLETKFGDIVFQKGKSLIETGDDFININGDIYQNDVLLNNIFLAKTGGTITNDLTVNGTLSNPIFNNLKGSSVSNANYNDMTSTGVYYMTTGCTNAPTSYCWLQVLSNNGDIVQIATSVSDEVMYYRSRNNGSWLNWKTLSIQENITSGSNSNGNWVKYPDGTMICHKRVSGTANITTAWGNGYTTGSTNTINLGDFAQTFIEEPNIQVTPHRGANGYNFFLATLDQISSSSAGKVSLLRFTSQSNVDYILDVLAVGKWK